MSDAREKQGDTGERLVEAAANRAAEKVAAQERARERPTPQPHDSTEMAGRALAWLECEERGPVFKLSRKIDGTEYATGKRMEKMEAKVEEHDKIIARFDGALKLSRWLVPMVSSLATSALAVGMIKLLWHGTGK